MQKILTLSNISEINGVIGEKVQKLMSEDRQQIEFFCSFEDFDILSFNYHEIKDKQDSKITIYLDKENIFFICHEEPMLKIAEELAGAAASDGLLNNEQLLYHFFAGLLKNDMAWLDEYELRITDNEDEFISGEEKDFTRKIISLRKDLLNFKRYYQQLELIFDELLANENDLLSESGVRYCGIIQRRIDHLLNDAVNLRDYIAMVLDSYQSQLDYRQNNLMKVFTVVTAIFLPLSLLAGWYGMNFNMPEFKSVYGYPAVIAVSAAIVLFLIIIFKKKKWM